MKRCFTRWSIITAFAFLLTGCGKEEPDNANEISVYLPAGNSVYIKGTNCKLMWWSKGPHMVDIVLHKGPDTVYTVATEVDNSGSFVWKVNNNVPEGRNYYFLVSDSENPDLVYDSSRSFAIIPQSEYSGFRDIRDKQNYNTVKIGNQWWMAENFKFVAEEGSYSYADMALNIPVYGRLYTLQAAIDNAPNGWHLPSDEEWKELESYLGIKSNEIDKTGGRGSVTGTLLKEGGGTGFNALYGGYHNSCVNYYAHNQWEAHFWTSTITRNYEPIVRVIAAGSGAVYRVSSICHDRSSVRYIKDVNPDLIGD